MALSHYPEMVVLLTALALAAIAIMLVRRRWSARSDSVHAVVLLFAVVIASRVALFTVLLATSQATDYERYLYPVMPLHLCTAIIVIHQAIRAARTSRTPAPA